MLWGSQVLAGDIHPFPTGTKATRVTQKPPHHWKTPAWHQRPRLQAALGKDKARLGPPRGFISEEPEQSFPGSTARCAGLRAGRTTQAAAALLVMLDY